MNKEEKEYIVHKLIKSNSIQNFGRKKLQSAELCKIHNDFVFKPKRFNMNVNKQDFAKKMDFVFNLKDKTIYNDLYDCAIKIFQQKIKGNPYVKKTYDSLDFIILKDKYKQFSDDKIKQLLISSYIMCVAIGEHKIEQ